VSHLVALEAELLIALKRVVRVLAAQNAVHPAAFVWTFSCEVAEFFAIAALDCRIRIVEIPRYLILQLGKCVIFCLRL